MQITTVIIKNFKMILIMNFNEISAWSASGNLISIFRKLFRDFIDHFPRKLKTLRFGNFSIEKRWVSAEWKAHAGQRVRLVAIGDRSQTTTNF